MNTPSKTLESHDTYNLKFNAKNEWITLFIDTLGIPYYYTNITQSKKVIWAMNSVKSDKISPVGVVIKKNNFGAIVLAVIPNSISKKYSIVPGSLILDINGKFVLFESFQSIQLKLNQLSRPAVIRFMFNGMISDQIYWDNELGLVVCPACDLASVESVDSNNSLAWAAGVRNGDILVQISHEMSVTVDNSMHSISYDDISKKIYTDSISSTYMLFIGPRQNFSTLDRPASEKSVLLLDLLDDHLFDKNSIKFSAIFQEDTNFKVRSEDEKAIVFSRWKYSQALAIVLQYFALKENLDNDHESIENQLSKYVNIKDFLLQTNRKLLENFLIQIVQICRQNAANLRFYKFYERINRNISKSFENSYIDVHDIDNFIIDNFFFDNLSSTLNFLWNLKSSISISSISKKKSLQGFHSIYRVFVKFLFALLHPQEFRGYVELEWTSLLLLLPIFQNIPSILFTDYSSHFDQIDLSNLQSFGNSLKILFPFEMNVIKPILVVNNKTSNNSSKDSSSSYCDADIVTWKSSNRLIDTYDVENVVNDSALASSSAAASTTSVLNRNLKDKFFVEGGVNDSNHHAIQYFSRQHVLFLCIKKAVEKLHSHINETTQENRDKIFQYELLSNIIEIETRWRGYSTATIHNAYLPFETIIDHFNRELSPKESDEPSIFSVPSQIMLDETVTKDIYNKFSKEILNSDMREETDDDNDYDNDNDDNCVKLWPLLSPIQSFNKNLIGIDFPEVSYILTFYFKIPNNVIILFFTNKLIQLVPSNEFCQVSCFDCSQNSRTRNH